MKKFINSDKKMKDNFLNGITKTLALFFLMVSWNAGAFAQETSNVDIIGIPGTLPNPLIDEFQSNFDLGIYQVQFTYSGSMAPREFEFHLTVIKNGRTLLNEVSDPQMFEPGTHFLAPFFEEVSFPISVEDVLDSFDSSLQNQIIQTGALPEGNYSFRLEARPVDPSPPVSVIPGIANFVVRFPQPPILTTPPDNSNVTTDIPVFTWTPVVAPGGLVVEYDFLLVEVFRRQSPGDALLSNRPQHETVLTGMTTLPYTPDLLPLEPGSMYAWQVTARDVNEEFPFAQDGESEIYTFTFKADDDRPDAPDELELITLVPQFAELMLQEEIEITEQPDVYVVNGIASVTLDFADGTSPRFEAMVNNLSVLKTNLDNPVITGGSVSLFVPDGAQIGVPSEFEDYVMIEDVTWSLGTGFQVAASLSLPFGDGMYADGTLQLDRNGPSGVLEVTGDPIIAYGDDYVNFHLTKLRADFTQQTLAGDGDFQFFGMDTGCSISQFDFFGSGLSASVNCLDNFEIPLVEGSTLLNMEVNRLFGNVSVDMGSEDFDYDLEIRSTVGFMTTADNYCGTSATVKLHSEDGVGVTPGTRSCPVPDPRINLGFAELALEEIDLTSFSYDASSDEWDFGIQMDARFSVPLFEYWQSTLISGIVVNRDGIEFEEIDFGITTPVLPEFQLHQLQIQLETLTLSEFTFPLFDWDETGAGPWEIGFSGNASILSSEGMPYCLIGTSLELTNGRIESESVVSDLALADFDGCEWELGPGLTLHFDAISGQAGAHYPIGEGIEPFGEIAVAGGASLDGPFDCDDGDQIAFSGDDLVISEGINGVLTNVVPGCPVQIGPFTAQVTSSNISFSKSSPQQAIMDAEAELTYGDGQTVTGSFELDLINGNFLDVSFLIDEPFEWHVPSEEDGVMSFLINSAEINQDGFFVDGRHEFILPDSEMEVTFDNLLLDIGSLQIKSGRIVFDESFGFEIGIPPADLSGLIFSTVGSDHDLVLDSGIMMQLGATVIMDSTGVRTEGSAEATIAFDGMVYDNLVSVAFSEDFAIGLNPFGVGSGQADFYFDGDRFAYIDPAGFHPVLAFFADYLIPEKLPLPTESIAYIQLRDDDQLFVGFTENDEGNLEISTIPEHPLTLVVPYLNPASPPELANVSIEGLILTPNPYSPEVVGGSISAEIPPGSPLADLTGKYVPLSLENLVYEMREVDGSDVLALFLEGNMNLFEQELESDQNVAFQLRGDGFVRASLDVSGLDARLALTPGEQAVIAVDAVNGSFVMPVGSTVPDFDFYVTGGFEVLTDEGYHAGADLTLRTQSSGYFSVTEIDAFLFDESPRIGLGDFGINLDELISIPEFSYTPETGFEFAVELDLSFDIGLAGDNTLSFPLKGVEIRHDGVHFPAQDINDSSIPGLSLPEIDLAGFGFKPLALRTPSAITYSWGDGLAFDPNISMDFSVELPEFDGTGLNPPDGLQFVNVGFDEGFLVGAVEPFNPIDGVEIPLAPGDVAPSLIIEEISGALSKVEGNSWEQAVDFNVSGSIGDIPSFTVEDPGACEDGAEFSLAIIEGRAFEGSITGVQPCGYLELGPFSLEVVSAGLEVYLDEGSQMAELDGAVDITLPAPGEGTPAVVSGALTLDLMTGSISDGSVAITQPFDLNMPFTDDDPLFTFAINEASISEQGLTVTGAGQLERDDIEANVNFNELTIGLLEFGIFGGSATIDAAFDAEFTVSPLALSLVDPDSPMPDDNAVRMDLTASLMLDENGLGFSGSADASVFYGGEQHTNLRVELEDDFAVSLSGLSVTRGRAEFYWDEGGIPAEDPLAWISVDGFHFGAGLIGFLPDRIPLPTEDIAYIDIKDGEGNPLINVEDTDTGFSLSTDTGPINLVIPALEDDLGNPLQTDITFTLLADDAYNITGGSIAMESDFSLEDRLNLPVSLTTLELEQDEGLKLKAGLRFELPAIFEGHEADVMAVLTPSGIESATFSVGNYSPYYDPAHEPLYSFEHSGTIEEEDESDVFSAGLLGIEATFGSNSVSFSGKLRSSLIMEDDDDPLFFAASWEAGNWSFNLDPGGALDDINFGNTTLSLDGEEPFAIVSEENLFYVSINGQVSFEEVLDEPIVISVSDLQVGIADWHSSVSLHLALGEAVGEIGDQEFGLFDDSVIVGIINPSISLSGRHLAIAADGEIEFLDQDFSFEGLSISTDGVFGIDQVSVSDIEIIGEYLVMQTLSVSYDDGIRLDSEFRVKLPEPLEEHEAVGLLSIYRDSENEIQVDGTGLQFALEDRFELANFGELELTHLTASLDPFNLDNLGLYANGSVYVTGKEDPVVQFGESSGFFTESGIPENPGIGLSYSQLLGVQVTYNITGNGAFDFDMSFFRISIDADITGTSEDGFAIELSGTAGMSAGFVGLEADLGYEGILITEEGLVNRGNLDGTGSVEVANIITLELGQFEYKVDDDGFSIEIAETNERSPEELQQEGDFDSGEVETQTVDNVVELFCFGPCPAIPGSSTSSALKISISADPDSDDGGFSGNIESIFFYRTATGDRLLYIENAGLKIGDSFNMNASLNYVQEGDDILVRAAATGSFDIGNVSASAVVAGKFSNLEGQTSFGLFVAVQSDVGIPIVPGVVDLTGAGGGFFYRPDPKDLEMVHQSLGHFGYELVESDAASIQDDADFAVMLYAAVGIAGTADAYVVEGATFMQITSQSFYIDARVNVLGMDGDGSIANTKISGAMFAHMSKDPFQFATEITVTLDVPVVLDGHGKISYFLAEVGDDRVWGIIGNFNFDVFGGSLNGSGEFMAGPPGFLFNVGLEFGVEIPIITVKAGVEGEIWIMMGDQYQFPFGAFVTFWAEACVWKICAEADAKAAFVTKQPSGFELFASVRVCGSVLGKSKCGSAWASLSDDGLDAGRGSGEHADLIVQAEAQRQQFVNEMENLRNQLQDAIDVLQEPASIAHLMPSEDDFRQAGYNFYDLSYVHRMNWADVVEQFETDEHFSPSHPQSHELPSALQDVLDNVMRADRPEFENPNTARIHFAFTVLITAYLMGQFEGIIEDDIGTAIDFVSDAEASFDDMVDAMGSSPIGNVSTPPGGASTSAEQSITFELDDDKAGNQSASIEQYREEIEGLDQQFRESIDAVHANLEEMHGMLQTDIFNDENYHLINVAHQYGELYHHLSKYHAHEANKNFTEHGWANHLMDYLNDNADAISNASAGNAQQLYNVGILPFTTTTQINSLNNLAWRTAQRVHFVDNMRKDVEDRYGGFSLPAPNSSSAPSDVQELYETLSHESDMNTGIRDQLTELNENFWYNMHIWGLQTYANTREMNVINDVFTHNKELIETMIEPHKNITGIIDRFYGIKANMTAILYNMTDNYLQWRESIDMDTAQNGSEDPPTPPAPGIPGLPGIGGGLPLPDYVLPDLDIPSHQVMYAQLLGELSNQLQPPQITNITVNPSRPAGDFGGLFYNETEIQWNATHPVEVIETSVNIEQPIPLVPGSTEADLMGLDDTDIAVGIDDYLSIGNRTSFTIFPFRMFADSREIRFGVRVRGFAGNTAIRRATFHVDVGPDPGVDVVTPGQSVVPDETNPPEAPDILLSSKYNSTNEGGTTTYWTSDPELVNLVIRAHDPEVGIGSWQYAIGTSPGETDVMDWSDLQGQISMLSFIPAQQIIGPSRVINMEEGQHYYVSARVENTMEQMSPVTSLDTPIVFDGDPPSVPTAEIVQPEPHQPEYDMVVPLSEPIASVPPYDPSISEIEGWFDTFGDPTLYFDSISSSDGQSGLSHFEYVLGLEENPPMSRFDNGDVHVHESGELTITGSSDDPVFNAFNQEVYLHIRAVDLAGNPSEIASLGPYTSFDHTIPIAGTLQAKLDGDNIRVYITRVPYDPESDLLGIQYAVGTSTWEGDLRGFPEGSDLDMEWNLEKSETLATTGNSPQRYFTVPTDGMPIGESIYILYRSVNTYGMYSILHATGPVNLDTTPPLTPSVNVIFDTSTRKITVNLSGIEDPESGIDKVEFWVQRWDPFDWNPFLGLWQNIVDETEIQDHFGIKHGSFGLDATSPEIPEEYDALDLRVRVRLTNGAGLTRTVSVKITEDHLFTPIIHPPIMFIPIPIGF